MAEIRVVTLADFSFEPEEEDRKNRRSRSRSRSRERKPKEDQKQERPVVLVIRPGIPLKEFKLGPGIKHVSVKFIQRHLQGLLEPLMNYEANLEGYHVYCDGEGLLKNKKVNPGAARHCQCTKLEDQVVGTVVIVDENCDGAEDDVSYDDPNKVPKHALELADREFKEGLVLE